MHHLVFSERPKSLGRQADTEKDPSFANSRIAENNEHLKTGALLTGTGNSSTVDKTETYLSTPTIGSLDFAMLICGDPWSDSSINTHVNEITPMKRNNKHQTSKMATKRGHDNQGPAPSSGIVMKYLEL